VVGLLGILKAGGAYLPLDPAYPVERLDYMVSDAGAAVVVTQAVVEARLGEAAVRRLRLDADRAAIEREPDTAPLHAVHPDNLAYVIYTSGSTGRPKGVMGTHRNACKRLGWDAAEGGGGDVYCQKTSPNFLDAYWEVFMPLLQGGRTVIAGAEAARDPQALRRLLIERQVERLALVPSLLHAMLALPDDGSSSPSCLRSCLIGGEAVTTDVAEAFGARWPQASLLNVYGITETWDVSWYDAGRLVDSPLVPIGRPLPNTQVYVLDRDGHPAAVGVMGELCVGGAGLSRGYRGRAGLTAERFVPSPFGDGERLYRSGDLARWRPDGELECAGRGDHQVKLRGYRIELGEIEAQLVRHPLVREAVVTAPADGSGERRLVAYCVAQAAADDAAVGVESLRAHAQAVLPDYMVPSAFVVLEALPRLPNGKLDRAALPAPGAQAYAQRDYVAPRNVSEQVLASIWCELLKLDRVGIHDNFFELGGHSLLAMRVATRIRDAFQLELPLRTLFEAPVLADLAARIEAAREGGIDAGPLLVAQERGVSLPLSFAQERMWLLEQIEEVGNASNLPVVVRLQGDLNVGALEQAIGALVERHETLRTRIAMVDGQGVQAIEAAGAVRLALDDVSGLGTAEEIRERVRRIVMQEASRPFELLRETALRARLVRFAANDHVLSVVIHHIASDGWSTGVLLRELGALYGAFVAGRPSPLPALPVQYADYAVWQRAWLSGDRLQRQIDYWRERLSGAPAALELAGDRRRPAVQSFRGGRVPLALPAELTAKLQALARSQGATLFMVLLAAFQAVLSRWSGQDDIVVGTPIAGRTRREVEGLIGLFVNTLALRLQLGGDPSFRELVKRAKESALGAYAHQDLPFEKLVQVLQPARDMSRHPLFQALFALQNMPQEALELPGLTLSRMGDEVAGGLDPALYRLDLALYLQEAEDGGLVGLLRYATDLFDAATVTRLSGHLKRLLEVVAEDADRPLSTVSLLSEAERRQVVEEWNATAAAYPQADCLHELFTAQAAKTPDAMAVIDEAGELSYRELERRSNRLAHHLRGLGVSAESVVGLCVERSAELVVGLLGILKAGGAYLPLDPAYPVERLDYMVSDAGAAVVVTQAAVEARLGEAAVRRLRLDADRAAIEREPDTAPLHAVHPDNLAYVIYTSGSTGRPKGVMVAHQAVVNFLTAMARDLQASHDDVVVAVTPVSFDIAGLEIFLPLTVGARMVLASREVAQDGDALRQKITEVGATLLQATPSSWRMLFEAGWQGGELKALCGGEALAPDLAASLARASSQAWNMYGPTETTVWSTSSRLGESGEVLIGRPILNTQVYVLDRHGRPAAIGVAGELHIGGAGLARGYFGRAGLTAERFVPSPFGDGVRLYRTGDLARWRLDGELEYLGRIDHQVKLRGYRIELGEIEAQLVQHPQIGQAVVVADEDGRGERRLVAYVIAGSSETELEPADLRSHLQRSLPDHMVPAAFVQLAALPLTPNGKIDRKALPKPGVDGLARGIYEAPRTETEQVLAGIWSEMLGIERIGIHDNFFELGGHSLLATRVIVRIRDRLGFELPLRTLFETPTIAEIAIRILPDGWEEDVIGV